MREDHQPFRNFPTTNICFHYHFFVHLFIPFHFLFWIVFHCICVKIKGQHILHCYFCATVRSLHNGIRLSGKISIFSFQFVIVIEYSKIIMINDNDNILLNDDHHFTTNYWKKAAKYNSVFEGNRLVLFRKSQRFPQFHHWIMREGAAFEVQSGGDKGSKVSFLVNIDLAANYLGHFDYATLRYVCLHDYYSCALH